VSGGVVPREPAIPNVPTGSPPTEPPPVSARRRTELVVWLALIVALVALLQTGTPPRIVVLSLIAVALTLAVSLRWPIGGTAVIVLLVVGVALRLAPPTGFSDALQVT